MDARPDPLLRAAQPAGLSTTQTIVVAAAAGLSVANIYFAQPLLDLMAADFHMAPATIGLIVTLTQVGYGLGLILIVPIGDLVDRRHLILVQGLLSALGLTVVATAATGTVLLAGMAVVGVLAVLVQVLVAHAAALATPAQRGRVVGMVTSGVVTGILAARSVAGVVADAGGWRAVYLGSAVAMVLMVGVLLSVLPRTLAQRRSETYGEILVSIPRLFRSKPDLLLRGALALLIFASFSSFWTALVLPLSAPPLSLSHTLIGLFGLVGMVGAMAATQAGRLADRGHGRSVTGVSLALLLASWGLIAFLPVSIPVLVAGVLLMDMAVQAVHVTNLAAVVALQPHGNGRLIGGYMVFYAVGSALGAGTATAAYDRFGWTGVCWLGAAFSATALALWGVARLLHGGRRREVG